MAQKKHMRDGGNISIYMNISSYVLASENFIIFYLSSQDVLHVSLPLAFLVSCVVLGLRAT